MRLAILGDIHGCYKRFCDALAYVGMDAKGVLPADVIVVQVGDLVHGDGEDQEACVDLANTLIELNPQNYVQLLGNHDAHYLGGPDVSSRKVFLQLEKAKVDILKSWLENKVIKFAYAQKTMELGDILITHGGLTAGLWKEIGSPHDAFEAAKRLNELDLETIFRPGWLMTSKYDMAAGILGPRTGAELAASWLEEKTMPFFQIHGHESVWWWPTESYHDDVPENVKKLSVVDHQRRQSLTMIHDKALISIDAKLDSLEDDQPWQPLMLSISKAGHAASQSLGEEKLS